MLMAGDEGFEPPISGPEPDALPLGQSPITRLKQPSSRGDYTGSRRKIQVRQQLCQQVFSR